MRLSDMELIKRQVLFYLYSLEEFYSAEENARPKYM